MSFHVGQKVVCVNAEWDDPHWCKFTPNRPVAGGVYTIREIHSAFPHRVGFYLDELPNPVVIWVERTGEGAFLSTRFRPVIERKTDISVFTALLNPANHKHLEDVR